MSLSTSSAFLALFVLALAGGPLPTPAAADATAAVQSDPRRQSIQRQQQYTATLQALRTLEAMLASATLGEDARTHMRNQLDALQKYFEANHPAELKIAHLKLEMKDLRDKQGGAISGGNLEAFAEQESKVRRRELEILLEIRELEKQIGR